VKAPLWLLLLLWLLFGCAYGVDNGPPADPCDDCWAWCGAKERTNREVIFCAPHCTEVCS
jgi:hypothetical protein